LAQGLQQASEQEERDMNLKWTNSPLLLICLAIPSPGLTQANQPPGRGQSRLAEAAEPSRQADLRSYLIPIQAGLKSAETSIAALSELASTEPFEVRGLLDAARLAEESVEIAHGRTTDIARMQGLSEEPQKEARSAETNLQEASAMIADIQQQMASAGGRLPATQAEHIRDMSAKIRNELHDAEEAIQRFADHYGLSTDLARLE
jgi:hypothetical protein